MKKKNRDFEIFSLSFLDIISCGFGAIVLLVLISDFNEVSVGGVAEETQTLLSTLFRAEEEAATLEEDLKAKQKELISKKTLLDQLEKATSTTEQNISQQKQKSAGLKRDLEGLELVEKSIKRAAISVDKAKERDEEAGGIPVDADYVVFIVDTSGSMKQIWSRVTRELENVIDIHPKIKGFQILNDNGIHLVSAWRGRWIPDTPARRKSVIRLFKNWNSASNSSPVEGLRLALTRYAKPGQSMSIYIFGDDYTGSSYDPVIDALVRLNTDRKTGKPLAKVHGVGFISEFTTSRFPILMREVARRNGGTYIGLPR